MPGVGKEQMKSYGKTGSFELNGVLYTRDLLEITVERSRSVLVLDCADPGDLDSFCADVFVDSMVGGAHTKTDVFVHMSAAEVVGAERYLALVRKAEQHNPKALHLYVHPDFANSLPVQEERALFGEDAQSFAWKSLEGAPK